MIELLVLDSVPLTVNTINVDALIAKVPEVTKLFSFAAARKRMLSAVHGHADELVAAAKERIPPSIPAASLYNHEAAAGYSKGLLTKHLNAEINSRGLILKRRKKGGKWCHFVSRKPV
ncbi:MAG: hypothetical protein Q8K86_09050 [Candidatus Nanopelagicaceae bacterium]|nr:hypothetical protein [Candidatus Nanopelagicaceae bacterium]